ncbi:hypothetical protein TNCV_2051471 [Trichonephila clavipes]|nr:hypothetical protein TNCV_2051471 [Trichonephila clavipes]
MQESSNNYIRKGEIGMCVGCLPTSAEIEIGEKKMLWIDQMIEEIIIAVFTGIDLRGTRGNMDLKTGIDLIGITVISTGITDGISPEIGV